MRPCPSKDRAVNCFPSFLITWITSSSSILLTPLRLSFFKCWQLSAIRRTVSPLNSCWKENIHFTFTETVPIKVLITEHYKYKRLMHNKEVLYSHLPFSLSSQKGRQCTYHVTMRWIHATIVVVEEQYILYTLKLYAWRFCYQALNAHSPYCNLWPLQLYHIIQYYLINGTIFGADTEREICVLNIFKTLKHPIQRTRFVKIFYCLLLHKKQNISVTGNMPILHTVVRRLRSI